ncbi:MAG: hypothetical protein QNI91_07990 [Arenicellales bacterium]|nr:hypothetical protein [Arenicellales bacterium]
MFDVIKGFFVSDAFWVVFTLLVVVVLIVNKLKEKSTGKGDSDTSEYYDGCAEYYEDLDSFSTRK